MDADGCAVAVQKKSDNEGSRNVRHKSEISHEKWHE